DLSTGTQSGNVAGVYGSGASGDINTGATGKEDMSRFINALLPLPTLDENSTAKIDITFVNGRFDRLIVDIKGVMTEGKVANATYGGGGAYSNGTRQEKLYLDVSLKSGGNVGVNEVTSVAAATVADQYATVSSYENIKTAVSVSYGGGITRNENVAWDYSEVRSVIASGRLDGINGVFNVNGIVGNTNHPVTMKLYIINGGYSFSATESYEINPYNPNWRSALPTSQVISFNLSYGGSGQKTFTASGISWDTSAVKLNLGTRNYIAYMRWSSLSESRLISVVDPGEWEIASVSEIPTKQFYVSNVGAAINTYSTVTVTFKDANTGVTTESFSYGVSWYENGSINWNYGTRVRKGRITVSVTGETREFEQTVNLIALATNFAELRNNDSTTGLNAITKLFFYTEGGVIKSAAVTAKSLTNYIVMENNQPVEKTSTYSIYKKDGSDMSANNKPQDNGTYKNGGYGGKLNVTVSDGNWLTPLLASGTTVTVPVDFDLGAAYDDANGSSGKASKEPVEYAGAYVDTGTAGANVYQITVGKGTVVTASMLPTMVLRATTWAYVKSTASDGAHMMTLEGNPELHINWDYDDFATININTPGTYTVTGRLYYRNTSRTVTCRVVVQ
ncbi:MAG: hypothetical protein LBQ40_02225, partial [Clostridiales bacterium]|nr:hypothetical protein [Clostridiales bacterium]